MIRNELLHLVNENQTYEEPKTLIDLGALSPDELQKVELKLNPHEMMEQIHYRLKERIIDYSISKQKERRKEKTEIEQAIGELKEELKHITIGEDKCLEKLDRLAGKENSLQKIEEHLAKGASIRSRQE